jgi:hypothetical protein
VIERVWSRYADFGPSLGAQVLLEKDGVKVSRETLHVDGRGWVVAVAQAAKKLSSAALAASSLGELIQIDGSEHRWFEDRDAYLFFLVFIDDATESRIL